MASHKTGNVGTTATLVWRSSTPRGDDLVLSTQGAGTDVFFGGSGVTTTSFGFRLANNTDAFNVHVPYGQAIYAVVAAGSANIGVYSART